MLNEVIRTLRKRRGLTQEQLAEYLGVSVMTVRRWEWGERMPDVDAIRKISQVLEVPISELLTETTKESSPEPKANRNVLPGLAYWGEVADNARLVAQGGQNLSLIYSLLSDATSTVKTAMGKQAVAAV